MADRTRILVVDDDRDLVDALTMILEEQGYDVVQAYDAPQGLEAAVEERPDLIVLDIMMPEATEGFHVVWQLRKRSEDYFRNVPIIVLTAIHQKTPLRFYPDAGDGTYAPGEYLPVQGFVDKPVDPNVLLSEVERVLAIGGAP
ncbi:MAG: response regulator [Gemmatimonadota bacterium]|nr:MAG: response regulator [Gemmatimonadota bacterium]